MSLSYRREIDGLRAVAVVPVILFHAGFSVFSGGFVGVDVFFVISGYLITGILIADLAAGQFSLLRFYERRARRILPALFVVMLACLPFAWAWMMPSQLREFSQSIVAVTLFASNVLFWMESGYFDAAAEEKPLLHTWSLAVEEQYYVIFPLLLLLLWRMGRPRLMVTIVVLAVASLGLSEWLSRRAPDANFFLAPSRAWELLAGSICALVLAGRAPWRSDALSLTGLAMIVLSVFIYDETTPFPSLYALLPVGGTALFILCAGTGSLGARLMSLSPFVGIGLISYSAYLWHQPLFAFARIRSITTPDPWLMGALSLLALGLAVLSVRYIESPFRGKKPALLKRQSGVFIASAVGGALFLVSGLAGHLTSGFPSRIDPISQSYAAIARTNNPYREVCQFGGPRGRPSGHPVEGCTDFMTGSRIDVAFIGDSHVNAFSHVAQKRLAQEGLSSYAVTSIGCVGLPGFARARFGDCDAYTRDMIAFLKDRDVGVVVLAARFAYYLEGDRFDNGEGGLEYGVPSGVDLAVLPPDASRSAEARKKRVAAAYQAQVTELAKHFKLVLIYPIPEAGWNVPQIAAAQSRFSGGSRALDISTSYERYKARSAGVIAAFDAVDSPNLYRIHPDELFCDTVHPGRCMNALGDVLYYRDDDHLSDDGAALLAELLAKRLPDIVSKEHVASEH